MDNPLVKCGSEPYQPREPINLTYDAFGPPAALVRGLFEYIYTAEGLTLVPHIPPGISELEQHFLIRFGQKRLFLGTAGQGPITRVLENGRPWKGHTERTVSFTCDSLPQSAEIWVLRGAAQRGPGPLEVPSIRPRPTEPGAVIPELEAHYERVRHLGEQLSQAGLASSYEAAHVRLALDSIGVAQRRRWLIEQHRLQPLPEPAQSAADKLYLQTAIRICDGLEARLN
jgi:hypothetical protein